jgi:tartrate dehydratase alpha subunit/fumarate hydratase class I-like protein
MIIGLGVGETHTDAVLIGDKELEKEIYNEQSKKQHAGNIEFRRSHAGYS